MLRRSSSLSRKTPIRRKTYLRSKGKGSYARRPRDLEHMKLVRRLPCMLSLSRDPITRLAFAQPTTLCRGRVEADHAGKRGIGQKSPDDTTIPLCSGHHHERTNLYGSFKDWQAPAMRLWLDAAIAMTRAEVRALDSLDRDVRATS